MAVRDLTSFLRTAEELLGLDLPRLGEILLRHLHSWKDQGRVWQAVGGLNRGYFFEWIEGRARTLGPAPTKPAYESKQPEVSRRLQEAWNWLEREGLLMHNPNQPLADWYVMTTEGEELLSKLNRFERWDQIGVDLVKQDLANGGRQFVGGPPKVQKQAIEWVRTKEGLAMLPAEKRAGANNGSSFIADSRIEELRKLASPDFDFQKLIRLCEELNSSYDQGNMYASAMLTRAILDHVPPLFGYKSFIEVANNYSGNGHSFKDTMQHLEGAARKISDGHLHMPIRKSETLPTPQQVYCGSQLDALLSEIVRIMK
jgi:hypothetical protein